MSPAEQFLVFDVTHVRALMARRGISKAALARGIGVHVRTVDKWQDGYHQPKEKHLEAMALLLGVPSETLTMPWRAL